MRFQLPEEVEMLQKVVRKFVKNELMPYEKIVIEREASRGLNDTPLLPPEIEQELLAKAKSIGLYGINVPAKYGGQEMGALAQYIAIEELYRTIVPFTFPPDAPNLNFLEACCNEEQREKYLLPYARGEKRSCLALTEPAAGADVQGIQMKAERVGDKWVLNGNKIFISFIPKADFIVTIAVTDKEKGAKGGITAFIVDKDTPGLTIPSSYPTIGEWHPHELLYENVVVGDDKVLGEVGWAFVPLQNRLGIRRLEIAAWSVGRAQRCLDMMIEFANTRKTFSQPLAERQAVQWWIADSAMEIHQARLMSYEAAWKIDQGMKDLRMEASRLKVFATEMLGRVADRAIQLFGGMGVSKELPLEYIYRSSRIYRIIEGPSEIHRMSMAKKLLKAGK